MRIRPGEGVVALPSVPDPSAAGETWQRVDIFRLQQTGVVDATGAATLRFQALDANERWHISRVVIVCGGSITPDPTVQLHIVQGGDTPSNQTLVSGTTCGLFDEADYAADDGLVVLPGEQLQVTWAGAPVGQTAVANVQYELYSKSGG